MKKISDQNFGSRRCQTERLRGMRDELTLRLGESGLILVNQTREVDLAALKDEIEVPVWWVEAWIGTGTGKIEVGDYIGVGKGFMNGKFAKSSGG